MTEGSAEQEQRERRRDDFEGLRHSQVSALAKTVTHLGQARAALPLLGPRELREAIAETERLVLAELCRRLQDTNPYERPGDGIDTDR